MSPSRARATSRELCGRVCSMRWATMRRDPEALEQARKNRGQGAGGSGVGGSAKWPAAPYDLAALNGDAAFYDRVMAALKNPKSPEEYYMYLFTLPQFNDPKLLERTLEFAVSPDVRSQDALQVVAGVHGESSGRKTGLGFYSPHWDAKLRRRAVRLPAPKWWAIPAFSATRECAIR